LCNTQELGKEPNGQFKILNPKFIEIGWESQTEKLPEKCERNWMIQISKSFLRAQF
jgi:hypothetical protein